MENAGYLASGAVFGQSFIDLSTKRQYLCHAIATGMIISKSDGLSTTASTIPLAQMYKKLKMPAIKSMNPSMVQNCSKL